MMKKSWEKKVDNKGFTLVELIVVLVILAILAAILVPALLGYIDRAKGSQLLLNGKSVLTAAQAEASNAYGTATGEETIANKLTADVCARVGKTADTPDKSGAYFSTGIAPAAAGGNHAAWTIKQVAYWEGEEDTSPAVYFNGSSWEEGLTKADVASKITAAKGGYTRSGDTFTGVEYK